MRTFRLRLLVIVVLLLTALAAAQRGEGMPPQPLPQDTGRTGLDEMLLRLHTTARLMHITAHPDDEDGGMLVLESRGKGVDTLLLTLNRGEGGQNKLGSNLFDELGVLRTLELLAADRYYDVQQRFTRVADFGYSKTAEETFAKWHGHDPALGDMVRVIRTFRPDVIASRFQGTPADGHGNHQAAGILAREAFRAAADPRRFPEQIQEGLQPWQPKKLYTDGFHAAENYTVKLDTGAESPLLGTSYVQFAMKGLKHQLSQGAGSWEVKPGPHYSYYKLADTVLPQKPDQEKDLFEGVDASLTALPEKAGLKPDEGAFLHGGLAEMEARVNEAQQAAAKRPSDAATPLLEGLRTTDKLIAEVKAASLPEAPKADLLANLETKRQQFEKAAQLALGLELHATVEGAPNGAMVVPGQTFKVTAELRNAGDQPVLGTSIGLNLPPGWTRTGLPIGAYREGRLNPGATLTATFTVTVPAAAHYTQPYWYRRDPETQTVYDIDEQYATLPFPPPPLTVVANYHDAGVRATVRADVTGKIEGKPAPIAVVPAYSVLLDPATQVVPTSRQGGTTARVDVRNYATGNSTVMLKVPQAWHSEPPSESASFNTDGHTKTLVFHLEPPRPYHEGRYDVTANLQHGTEKFAQGFSVVTREDLGTFYYYQPAIQHISVVDVKLPPALKVGYIMGAGDDIPTVLQEIGIDVKLISPDDLVHGDLSRYGTIVLGIRAYDTREDVRKNNQRLLDYVASGGTLLVQYNSGMADFNAGRYTPYPAQLSRARVSVEESPVTILAPKDSIFHYPNQITERDFDGWVQERGLYFMDKWDNAYQPLLASADPGEPPQEGGLLFAHYGMGIYIYTGYSFFRELPNGVPGAVRLFVNLLSAGHEPH
jgi:LmbE family N-acetylglucosaminyl deacetylase